MGVDALPLTPDKVMSFGAVLRKAGCRSGSAYTSEARQQHIRAGYTITGDLEQAIVDAKRGITRGIGPPSKLAEVWPGLWGDHRRSSRWGLRVGRASSGFALALLGVHAGTFQLSAVGSEVTRRLERSGKGTQVQVSLAGEPIISCVLSKARVGRGGCRGAHGARRA